MDNKCARRRYLFLPLTLALASVALWSQPSGLTNRVLVAVQNPSGTTGNNDNFIAPQLSMQIVSATNDSSLASGSPAFIASWDGANPARIENLPAEHLGAVFTENSSLELVDYAKEAVSSNFTGFPGPPTAVLLSHDQRYIVAASIQAGEVTIADLNASPVTTVSLNLPGASAISVNVGSTLFFAFAQDSNVVYYIRRLSASDSIAYANQKWPANATDCEPLNVPEYCAFAINSGTGSIATYSQQNFDHPFKALFSADGGSVFILNAGPGSGGTTGGITVLPAAPLLFSDGSQSGSIPASPARVEVFSGSSNTGVVSMGIVAGNTVYLAGQQKLKAGEWGGEIWAVNVAATPSAAVGPLSIADGFVSRMILADDNTLWIGSTGCNTGYRALSSLPDGCLTVVNTSNNSVAFIEPFTTTSMDANCCDASGDVTGIAAILGLHKVYYTENGQLYIRSTASPYNMMNNANVVAIGTALDVAFIDTANDTDNADY